ncbi:MAG: PIN domain-containing protein [Treponema sp.]|jgi:predicted nucleic acid-binding protein|nr:PIN domain-containing protein [Treponema sp.]
MKRYALDSNIVSYILRKDTQVTNRLQEEINKGNRVIIPPTVYYEITRGLTYINATAKIKIFTALCSSGIGALDKTMFDRAVSIYCNFRKKGVVVDDNDILIAAFCQTYNLTLVTNNTKHFAGIHKLLTENWVYPS